MVFAPRWATRSRNAKFPSPPDPYRYDPANPTPSIGGIGMLTGGPVNNRELEARPTSWYTPLTHWLTLWS